MGFHSDCVCGSVAFQEAVKYKEIIKYKFLQNRFAVHVQR